MSSPALRNIGAFIVLMVAACSAAIAAPRANPAPPAIPFIAAAASSTDDRHFTLSWNAPGVTRVKIYAMRDPAAGPSGRPIAVQGGNGRTAVVMPYALRWYFLLVPNHGSPLEIAERSLHFSATNFRDAGGYRTSDGRWVRMGVLYRSNALAAMAGTDVQRAEALGIRLVCDLRTDDERRRSPDPKLASASVVVANVLGGDRDKLRAMSNPPRTQPRMTPPQILAQTRNFYLDFVRLKSARAAYHSLFERLADPANLPTVFHCTGGKDRTGWGQAVLLTILGVPRETIIQDYTLSTTYLAAKPIGESRHLVPGMSDAMLRRLMAADPADLDAAFDEVNARYGSFEAYLREGLRLDDKTIAALRTNFLTN